MHWHNLLQVQHPSRVHDKTEDALAQLTSNTSSFIAKTETNFKNQAASIHNLKVQMDQIANMLSNRPQEALSSNTQTNPKKQVKSITLRSGKQLEQKQVLSESIHQKDSSEEAKEIISR